MRPGEPTDPSDPRGRKRPKGPHTRRCYPFPVTNSLRKAVPSNVRSDRVTRPFASTDEGGEYVPRQIIGDDLGGMSLRGRHRRHHRRVRRRRHRQRHGRQGRQGRGPARHRLQVRGRHPRPELSIRHDVDPSEIVTLGDEIEALVLQKEDKEGRLVLSKKRAQYERAWGDDRADQGERRRRLRPGHRGRQGRPDPRHRPARLPARLARRAAPGARPAALRRAQPLEAKIIELDKNRNNVVLSRRAWLEETQKEQREEFLANLKPGEVRKGVVSSVVNFGAFVDLGGMDGLVHVSELSWKHVDHPSSVVHGGRRDRGPGARRRPRPGAHQPVAQGHPAGPVAGVRQHPPRRRAGLRPGHQAGAVRRLRPGGRGHRGPGAHLRDGGAPRRPARAGRHPGRGAVGQDHRPRPPAPPHQPVDQAGGRGRRGRGRVPRALRRARLRRRRATTSASPSSRRRPRPRRRGPTWPRSTRPRQARAGMQQASPASPSSPGEPVEPGEAAPNEAAAAPAAAEAPAAE